MVAALAQGLAITVAPHQTVLSTSEAACLLGCRGLPWSGSWRPGRSRSASLAATAGSGSPTCWPTSSALAAGARCCWIRW